MKKVKYPNLNDYDLSAYEELKGDVLYTINGGKVMDQADMYAMQQADAHHDEETKEEILKKYESTETPSSSSTTTTQTTTTTTTTQTTPPPTSTTPPATNTTPNTNNPTTSPTTTTEKPKQNPKTSPTSGSSTDGGTTTPTNSGNNSTGGANGNGGDNTTGRITYDRNDETKIYANLDDPNSLNAAMDLMADVGLGYTKVVAYSEVSGKTMEFTSYGEINAHLTKIQGSNSLLAKESDVKNFLITTAQNPDNYSFEVFQRRAMGGKGKKTDLMTHSFYLITDKTSGKKTTLSFNGTILWFWSEGAWGFDTETDVKGWDSYKNGTNDYDVSLYTSAEFIDVQKTSANIVKSINSDITYYYLDHLNDKPNKENCNTALFSTEVLKKR